MLDALKSLVDEIDALKGRVGTALDLTAMVRTGNLPQARQSAFIVPAGIRPRKGGEASANAYTQMVEEVLSVVLVVKSANDASGERIAPELDVLIWAVIDAVAGADPGDAAIGVFVFNGGKLLSLGKGVAVYQIDFSIQTQLRRLS